MFESSVSLLDKKGKPWHFINFFEGALEEAGISVWVDESALMPGAAYLKEIGEAIVTCRAFIVLLSDASVKSKYCQVRSLGIVVKRGCKNATLCLVFVSRMVGGYLS